MKKLPYQGGLTKIIAAAIGKVNREKFSKQLDFNLSNIVKQVKGKKTIAMEVASYTGSNDFCEQVLSILSFVRNVGIPQKWTLYSDGTHTKQQIEIVKKNFDFVIFECANFKDLSSIEALCKDSIKSYHNYFCDYANDAAFGVYGKKFFYFINHIISQPTLFIDSDILFYEQAHVLKLILTEKPQGNGWFMPDVVWGCLDSRYKARNSEQMYQVNGGFMLRLKEFENIREGLDFYKVLDFSYEHFSEQTLIHIFLKANTYMPLPTKTFILDTGDQFDFSYLYTPQQMAVRHYTGPVRHKMWQKDYKWHLGLK
jgi:hypothetical protein